MENAKAKNVMIVVLTVIISLLIACVIYMSVTGNTIQELFLPKNIISENKTDTLAAIKTLAENEYTMLLSENKGKEDIITSELIKSCLEAKGIDCSDYDIVLGNDGKITISKKETKTDLEQTIGEKNEEQQENVKVGKVKVNAVINELTRNSSVRIYWNEAENATNYEIYRAVNDKNGNYERITNSTDLIIIDENVNLGDTYYYKVRGRTIINNNEKIYGEYSDIVAVKIAPSVPTLEVVSDLKYVSIKYTYIDNASGYEVYRSLKKDGLYEKVSLTNENKHNENGYDGDIYRDKNLNLNNKYYYKVRSYYLNGDSKIYSDFSKIIESGLRPQEAAFELKSSSDSITLNWKKLESQDGYYIYRATQENGRDYKLIKETNNNTYTDKSNLEAGVTYYYAIQSYRVLDGVKITSEEWEFYPKTIAKINSNGIYVSSSTDYIVGETIVVGEYSVEISSSYTGEQGEEAPMIYIEYKDGSRKENYFKESGSFTITSDMQEIGLSQLTLKLK